MKSLFFKHDPNKVTFITQKKPTTSRTEVVKMLTKKLDPTSDNVKAITTSLEKFSEYSLNNILSCLLTIESTDPVFLKSLLEMFILLPKDLLKEFVQLAKISLEKISENKLCKLIEYFTVNVDEHSPINFILKEYNFLKFCMLKPITEQEEIDALYSKMTKIDALNMVDELERLYVKKNIQNSLSEVETLSSLSSLEHESALKTYLAYRDQLPSKILDPFEIKVFEETGTPFTVNELQKIKHFLDVPLFGKNKLSRTRNRDGSLRRPIYGSKIPINYYSDLEQHLNFPLYYSVIKTTENKLFIIYPGNTIINNSKVTAKTLLGIGSLYTRVKLIQDLDSTQLAASKIQYGAGKALEDLLSNEKMILVVMKQFVAKQKIENKDYTLMNYIKGTSLGNYLQKTYITTKSKLKAIIATLEAVKQLHENNVLHCDLNLNNIIITTTHDISKVVAATLIDFAFSLLLDRNTKSATITQDIYSRNKNYLAPEYIQKQSITSATDLFTLGKLFQEFNDCIGATELSELFSKMCHQDPKQRPSIDTCINAIRSRLTAQKSQNPTMQMMAKLQIRS